MKRIVNVVIVAALAGQALVLGQGSDAGKILADVRAALGGSAVASAKSLAATGHVTRINDGVPGDPTDFEMAIDLPDKFVKKEVVAVLGDNVIARMSGFNGDGLIDAVDAPPGLMGGGGGGGPMVIRSGGGSSMSSFGGPAPSAEAAAAARKSSVLIAKQDFARLTLGLLGSTFAGYPLDITLDSPAVSPDGKYDVLAVKGDGDFAAKLYIDKQTHLPAMITWMAKEPLVRTMRSGGPGGAPVTVTSSGGGGGSQVMTRTFSSGSGQTAAGGGQTVTSGGSMTPEMRDQMMKDAAAAEANRRVVEFRTVYSDFKTVGGIKMPSKLTRSIDGKAADELVLEKIVLNPKIDPKKFEVVK